MKYGWIIGGMSNDNVNKMLKVARKFKVEVESIRPDDSNEGKFIIEVGTNSKRRFHKIDKEFELIFNLHC